MFIKHEKYCRNKILGAQPQLLYYLYMQTSQLTLDIPSTSPVTFCSRAQEVKSLAGFLFSPLTKFVFMSQSAKGQPVEIRLSHIQENTVSLIGENKYRTWASL